MSLDNCRDSYLEGPLACSPVAHEGPMDGPASLIAGDKFRIVHYELVSLVIAEVLALGK